MRRNAGRRIISLFLFLLILSSSSITTLATSTTSVSEAASVLVDVEEAQQALKELAAEREIPALLYMKDIYTIKTKPDINSNDVVSIATGQQVLITGVDEDEGHNIWYQVTYGYDEGEFSGYIQREYLAFSDERMHEWEDIHIKSMRMWAMRSAVNYSDIDQFPESYQSTLYKLKQQHPNWTFVKMETGLDWNDVVNMQSEGSRSLIWNNGALDSWKDGEYSASWAIASDGIIKYYLDPRNALTEQLVFQFEQLTYNKSYHSVSSTQKVLEGTFMDSDVPGTSMSYADAFMSIASEKNISPILMAARVRQEQGAKGSLMISGTYPGYEGLYNHYNIGASGNTQEKELVSGLTKAREMGWTTPMLSLSGGSSVLSNNYIRKGQDTLYLQKFDVDSSYNGVCWHQYMQNIEAPTSEAKSTYKAYSNAGIVDSSFVFKIPVYRNMPSYACTKPGSEDKITLNTSEIVNLPVNETAVLLSYINGTQNTSVAMEYISSDTEVATVDANGVVTGIKPGEATITCKRAENASGATTASCKVTVVKADIPIAEVEIPEIEVTYSPKQTLSLIELPDGFAWVDESVVPIVGNSGYSVTYNPDNSKYNTLTFTVPVSVEKATIEKGSLSLPSDLVAVAGDELKSVALPNGYSWDDITETVPKKIGTYTYGASYCIDEVNYEVLEDITLSVKVICKTHEFGEWEGSHADCIHDGKLARSCSICGETESVTEDALGHDYVSEITKEPTLIATGIRTYICMRCDDTYEVEIPAVVAPHTHEYIEEITIKATCEKTGIKTYTCDCKDAYTEVLEVLGHDVVDGECTRCDYVIQTLPQHTHSYTLAGSTETCTNDGIATYVCGCGEFYTEKTKALGHDIEDNKCSRCDYTTEAPDTGNDEDSEDNSGSTRPDEGTGNGDSSDGGGTGSDTGKNEGSDNNGGGTDNSGTTSDDNISGDDSSKTENEDSKQNGSDNSNKGNTANNSSDKKTEEKNSNDKYSDDENERVESTEESEKDRNIIEAIQDIFTSVVPNQNTEQASGQTEDVSGAGQQSDSQNENTDLEEKQDTAEETADVVKITMRHSTMLNKDKLAIITDGNCNLELIMADGVKWKINLSNVDDIHSLNVDMAVTMNEAEIPEDVLATLPQDCVTILMSLAHEGPFEFEATLSVPVNKLNAGKFANLFFYNSNSNEMEFVTASLVAEDGTAEFLMPHASDYVIVLAENSLNPDEEEITSMEKSPITETSNLSVSTGLLIIIIGVVAILVVIGIVLGIRFWKKKKEEDYYFDEEDELPVD